MDIFDGFSAIFSGGSDPNTTKSLTGPSGNTRDRRSSAPSSRLRCEMQKGCVERSAASHWRVHQDTWRRGNAEEGGEGLRRDQTKVKDKI
jgi:hypothetical protein